MDRRRVSVKPYFKNFSEFHTLLGGTRSINRLLIANNGLAAVKGIDSIRSWLYEHIGDSEAVEFVVMATPEDLQTNAEFVNLADQHVAVPGGPNSNNYANVELIMHTALTNSCDAIYPGWGHASENPALPRECYKSKKVIFLGPSEEAMFALGDKIASTIVAQSNGVPTVPWSGDDIRIAQGSFDVDTQTYERAYITTPKECEEVCRRVGFPVMIKASEGGGGKGIRRCFRVEDVGDMFLAVSEEVKGCHIFVMRMLENVRHLEVQLLADDYGDCIALRTRDCSVQRRHQKIVEEAPVFGVDPSILTAMEAMAIRLAKVVGYRGVGTVEYMYDKATHQFFFLELNPRLQVEHPVSELISGVNLPAALLCVGMGVPLHRIPEVRTFFSELPYESSPIDFLTRRSLPAKGHTIAVRVTAEDTDEGFRPTTGRVEEITFKNSKECWGYFSVNSGGEIHQFADTQFGHIFSSGETREDARRGMVMSLRNLVIRGEIHTSVSYVLGLLEREEFQECDISTAWLDRLIAERKLQEPHQQDVYVALIAASTFRMLHSSTENMGKYASFLAAGHVPSSEYLTNLHTESYVNRMRKFTVSMGLVSPSETAISLNGSVLTVPFRKLKSGALQLTIGGKTILAYAKKDPTSLRISIGGRETSFIGDVDPTKIYSSVPGRFVRYIVDHGGHVSEGMTIAEVEVMKMIFPMRATTAGVLQQRVAAGSTIAVGTLLGEIAPDDPSKVARPEDVKEEWPTALLSYRDRRGEKLDGIARARRGVEALWNMLRGYHFDGIPLAARISAAFDNLASLSLSSVALHALNLPFLSEAVDGRANGGKSPQGILETPNEKLRTVVSVLVSDYILVERAFNRGTRKDAVARMREEKDAADVFALDFAHHHPCHHEVVKAMLGILERNMVLLKSLQSTLSALLDLSGNSTDGSLTLRARYLLRQCSLPSFSERKAAFAKELEEGSITDLIQGSYGNDLTCAVMFDRHMPHLAQLCLELYIRREYFGECEVRHLDIFRRDSCWYGSYEYEPLADHDPLRSGKELHSPRPDEANDSLLESRGAGCCIVFPDDQVLRATWPSALAHAAHHTPREPSVCTVFFCTRHATEAEIARLCQQLLDEHAEALAATPSLNRVTFIVHGVAGGPRTFTFSPTLAWREDLLIRNVAPLSARRLELDRLANYDVAMYPTPFKEVHIFRATPRRPMLQSMSLEDRIFARLFVSPRDLSTAPWTEATEVDAGHILAKCLGALEFAYNDKTIKYPMYNHIFIRMVELTVDVATIKRIVEQVGKSYKRQLGHLGVVETELAFHVKVESGIIPFRVIVSSPNGYNVVMRTYYEWIENGKLCLCRAENSEDVALRALSVSCDNISDMAAACSVNTNEGATELPKYLGSSNNNNNNNSNGLITSNSTSDSVQRTVLKLTALRGMLPSRRSKECLPDNDHINNNMFNDQSNVHYGGVFVVSPTPPAASESIPLEPYEPMSPTQVKRLQARALHTVYVHEWPQLLSVVLAKQWSHHARCRGIPRDRIPTVPVRATELFLAADGESLVEQRPAGHTVCGMIVWLLTIASPAYYDHEAARADTRRAVMVANDITFQFGSFAVPEDNVFCAASVLARRLGVPFLYMSANSGARLGLSAEVKKRFRVAATASGETEYLYLLPEDYEALVAGGVELAVEERTGNNSNGIAGRHFEITGIVGALSEYIGVENLRGSGRVAGQMSMNYSTIPTISVVSGRSVGIGAYLNRLGRRVIQTNDAPLLLTGVSALNRLLGKEVYSDNAQLGGRQVMVPNGVTHWETASNYDSAAALLLWLDFVAPHADLLRCRPRVLSFSIMDPIDRDVLFCPQGAEPYDPRALVAGCGDRFGLFDRGSWREALGGWAKSVVVGRAALGGVPCGVVLAETRLTRRIDPADPADPTSAASFTAQAGQVWSPASARKTADAIEDFHRERLPCFILANWRGFSGGMRDMFDGVLKFGAAIADNLRVYSCPVFIYIPPHGELRGGAWAVVDPFVNQNGAVEMYCDPTARGGVMEPAGVVEIKFREADVRELIRRSNPHIASLDAARRREEEAKLLPQYRDAAARFADLHDTHVRMRATGVVRDVIPWRDARRIFHAKLRRKLAELELAADIVEAQYAKSLAEAVRRIEAKYAREHPHTPWGTADAQQLDWINELRRERGGAAAFIGEGTDSSGGNEKEKEKEREMDLAAAIARCKEGGGLDECLERLFADKEVLSAAGRAMRRVGPKGNSTDDLVLLESDEPET